MGEFKYNIIKFSDPALLYSLSLLVFTALLIYNLTVTESIEMILIYHWKRLQCMPVNVRFFMFAHNQIIDDPL